MTTTEVAKADNQAPPTLAQLIERQKPEIARALPRHLNPDRMARIATTTLRQTPLLARCTPESFLGALMSAAQLGLEPGPLGEAYLVPFRDGRTGNYQVTFIPGYKGLIKLAWQSGQLADIWAEVVYANDEFDYTLGLERNITHKPAKGARGEPEYVYAVAKLKDGGTPFVVMAYEEVESIRSRSKASKNGPWVTDWAAMAKKTAVKQLSKWLPMSSEFATAVGLDGSVRTDVNHLVDVQPTFIDGEAVEGGGQVDVPAAVEAASQPLETPPDEVFASSDQLKKLAQIQKAEKYDDAGWRDFIAATIQADSVAAVGKLTPTQAQQVIDLFEDEEASK